MGNPGSSAEALPTSRACRVAQQFCQLHPREPWNRSRVFPVQIWRLGRHCGCAEILAADLGWSPAHCPPSPNLSLCQCKAVPPWGGYQKGN